MNLQASVTDRADVRDDWASSPNLLTLDDQLDVVFGKLDAAGSAAETVLLIGTADIERGGR